MNGNSECGNLEEKRRRLTSEYEKKQIDEKRRGMVCRDFLRNSCKRGTTCKFQHPEISPQKPLYSFCHDFQNGECRRNTFCKFIHSSHEDELHYINTGELPPHLSDRYEKEGSLSPNESTVPICKQYIWSKCRHKNCKYKHVNVSEPQDVVCQMPSPLSVDDSECSVFGKQQVRQNIDINEQVINYTRNCCDLGVKRSYSNGVYIDKNGVVENRVENLTVPIYENGSCYLGRPERQKRSYAMLEEENIMLRERVGELKKRVDDLQVTNEFLLEQNAQLRIRDKNTAGVTTVTVPAVTITNTVPGATQIQQAPTPQQMVNAAIRTVTASVATVPVSLATVTPVSLAAVSMAPVQIPPPVVTMAQQAAPPPNDPQVPQALPMSISATAPLVSYPIVSHTVMQAPPDLHH